MRELVDSLRLALREQARPERAEHEQRYLKSTDVFLGVSVPAGQRIVKEFRQAQRGLPFAGVRALAVRLWQSEVHEEKRLAVQLLDAYAAHLTPEDWPLLEQWVREAGSWDLVDEIAAHLLGTLAERHPALDARFDQWICDPNLWIRRAALVSYVLRLRHATAAPTRVRALCDLLMTEREYFLRKALGWVLRECAVQDPEGTVAFLQRWRGATSRSIVREAVRKLDASWQQQVLSR